jgi:predicted transglutaminase-like cysteine proteinase
MGDSVRRHQDGAERQMASNLSFPGYSSFEVAPDDAMRVKWNAVRSALDVPASVELPALTLAGIGSLNVRLRDKIVYTEEPSGTDVWQPPAQTWAQLSGDCEDFAILKYAVLLKAGLPHESCRVVIGEIKSIAGNQPHAWCAAYIDGAWRALDNKFDQIIKVSDYMNWLPIVAMHDASVARFGREITINDVLGQGANPQI